MSDDQKRAIDRRDLLLGTSTLVAAATLTSRALAHAQKAAPAGQAPALRRHQGGRRISSLSSATMSARPMSAPMHMALSGI